MPLKPLKLTLPTLSLTPLAAVHRRAYRGLLAATITLGSAVVALPSPADTGHHHAPAAPSHAEPHQQHHQTLEIPEGQPLPTVSLIAHPDPVRGWNLEIQTTNFAFAPERVNQAHQLGEGHGHLYLNGEYVSRIYGNWLHIPALPPGRHELTVRLNSNSHEALTHQGQPLEATVEVDVPAP